MKNAYITTDKRGQYLCKLKKFVTKVTLKDYSVGSEVRMVVI